MNMKMLLRPISLFVAIQIVITWRHAAEGQNPQLKRSDQESVNPPANPADCDEECQCETEDNKSQRCVKEIKYCPALEIPGNVFSAGPCKKVSVGESCIFYCNENFILDGKYELFCTATFEWNGVVPQCRNKLQYCPALEIPDNVFSDGPCRETSVGEKCIFYCNENFILDGKDELFCTATLEWNGVVPQCRSKIKYCPELNIPDNVIWDGSCRKAKPGDSCRFKCKENIVLDGTDEIFCNSASEWSGLVPQCKEMKYCSELNLPDNVIGYGSCTEAKPGDKCRLGCRENAGREGKFDIHVVCNSASKWSNGLVPHCKEIIYCPELKMHNNVIGDGSCIKAKPGDKCRFKCRENFVLVGTDEIVCNSASEWSGLKPQCRKKIYCPELDIPDSVKFEGTCRKARAGEKCNLKCGHSITKTGICLDTLKWGPVEPQCPRSQ